MFVGRRRALLDEEELDETVDVVSTRSISVLDRRWYWFGEASRSASASSRSTLSIVMVVLVLITTITYIQLILQKGSDV